MTGKKAAIAFTLCLLACFVLPGMAEADKPPAFKSTLPTKVVTIAHTKPTLPEKTVVVTASIPLSDELVAVLYEACEVEDVPPALALAVMAQESGFTVDAVGWDGHDIGLFQIRRSNHAWLTEETGFDPMVPSGNIVCGVWFLAYLYDYCNQDWSTALTCWRWGPLKRQNTEYAIAVLAAAERWKT